MIIRMRILIIGDGLLKIADIIDDLLALYRGTLRVRGLNKVVGVGWSGVALGLYFFVLAG
jgi:hypothetical protein